MAEKLILLSYPRSGSDWIRYITETISGESTCNEYDNPEALMYKYHHAKSAEQHPNQDKLLLMLRDYREVILSFLYAQNHCTNGTMRFAHQLGMQIKNIRKGFENYFDNIVYYDNYTHAKEMVYYEDFVHDPSRTIVRLGRTLRLKDDQPAEDFLSRFTEHRMISLERKNRLGSLPTKTHGNPSARNAFWNALDTEQREWIEKTIDEIIDGRWRIARYVARYRMELPA